MKTNRHTFPFVFIGWAMLALNACSTPAATVTLAPTGTLAPTVTLAPTATLAPTLTPTPIATATSTATSLPTATEVLAAEDFYGTWTIWDRDAQGPNWLTFNRDGTFVATHGPLQGQLLHEGTYTLEGNKLTFLSWWFCDPDQRVGSYLIRLYPDKQSVRFFPLDEPCKDRAYDFTNRIILWDRFVPTATPAP